MQPIFFPCIVLRDIIEDHQAIHRPTFTVYILSNRPKGSLYISVTNQLFRRIIEHQSGKGSAFVQLYHLKRLVYYETTDDIYAAFSREKALKKWKRAWKIALIESKNPSWKGLFKELARSG